MRALLDIIREAIQDSDSKVDDRLEDAKISVLKDCIGKFYPEVISKAIVVSTKPSGFCIVGYQAYPKSVVSSRVIGYDLEKLKKELKNFGDFEVTCNKSFLQLGVEFKYLKENVICNLSFNFHTYKLHLNLMCNDNKELLDRINTIFHQK